MSYASDNDGRFERRAIAAFLIAEFAAAALCFGFPVYVALTNKTEANVLKEPTCPIEKIIKTTGVESLDMNR